MRTILRFIFWTIVLATTVCCKKNKKEDPLPTQPVNPQAGDEEIITRVELHLTDSVNTANTFIVKYWDEDGTGGKPATTDSLKLKPNTTYLTEIRIFDDTKKPAADISEEIEEEAAYHRFHYSFVSENGNAQITNMITDKDAQGQPLGLAFRLKTGSGTGKGKFNVNLRHFANDVPKTADPAAGEQDISLDFPARVQP